MTEEQKQEAFLKYATPRLNYIFDTDMDQGMEKRAFGRVALEVLKHALTAGKYGARYAAPAAAKPGGLGSLVKYMGMRAVEPVARWMYKPVGDTAQFLGKQYNKWFHPHATGPNALERWGKNFNETLRTSLKGKRQYYGNKVIAGGMTPENTKLLGRIGSAAGQTAIWGGLGAALMGKDLPKPLQVAESAINAPFNYLTPVGLAMNGINWYNNKVQQEAFDQVGQAALMTQAGIVDAIGQNGRAGHIMGAFSPQTYATQLNQKSLEAMRKRFAQEASARGLDNHFDELVTAYLNELRKVNGQA